LNVKNKISESIFTGETTIIPMADVQHIERHWYPSDKPQTKDNVEGYKIVTKHTTYNLEADLWENNIYLTKDEGDKFLHAWCYYRHELDGPFWNPENLKLTESPIDACVKDLEKASKWETRPHCDIYITPSGAFKEILLKHWPKETGEWKKYFRLHYCSSCKNVQEVETKSDCETVLNYPVCSKCDSCAWFPYQKK